MVSGKVTMSLSANKSVM